MMNKKLTHIFSYILLLAVISCGTGIGNGIFGRDPTAPGDFRSAPIGIPDSDLDFSIPINDYAENSFSDCGSFTENSSVAAIDIGRQCIEDALDTCTESKYLYNKTNEDGSRFVSFVNVQITEPGICRLQVHTVSDVPPEYIGDVTKTCDEILAGEIPEVACGILD